MRQLAGEQGFRCPVCGAQTRVKETRTLHDGGLRRRRICPSCRARLTTAEMLVAQDWSKGVRSKGPMVAIRKRDLQKIVDLASQALSDEDQPETEPAQDVRAPQGDQPEASQDPLPFNPLGVP